MERTITLAETTPNVSKPIVGTLAEKDLPEAARIIRIAFGTFLGAPAALL